LIVFTDLVSSIFTPLSLVSADALGRVWMPAKLRVLGEISYVGGSAPPPQFIALKLGQMLLQSYLGLPKNSRKSRTTVKLARGYKGQEARQATR
jgi:hypothetical protein